MLECIEILSIATQKGLHIYAVKGHWRLDDSIQSKIIAMAFAIAAEIERDLISQRTTEVLRVRKQQGKPLGRLGKTEHLQPPFAQSLQAPDFYEALKRAKPVSPVTGYQRMENRWRHYERLSWWPEGLVVIGDAVCAFNPIFGQGMTVAAQCAWELGQLLGQPSKESLTGLGLRAQKAFANVSATPWTMASAEDLRLPEAEGDRLGRLTKMLYWYTDAFRQLLPHSTRAMRTFVEVTHLLKPPTAMFHPAPVWSVFTQVGNRHKPE